MSSWPEEKIAFQGGEKKEKKKNIVFSFLYIETESFIFYTSTL